MLKIVWTQVRDCINSQEYWKWIFCENTVVILYSFNCPAGFAPHKILKCRSSRGAGVFDYINDGCRHLGEPGPAIVKSLPSEITGPSHR